MTSRKVSARTRETQYWGVGLVLPALVLAALASDMAAAGCYALTMNCFSIGAPTTLATRGLFDTARFLPYGLPAYLAVAASGIAVLQRAGPGPITRWLWIAPILYVAAIHASCALFASWVLPARRLVVTASFDLGALAVGYGYVALLWLAKPLVVRRRGPWDD